VAVFRLAVLDVLHSHGLLEPLDGLLELLFPGLHLLLLLHGLRPLCLVDALQLALLPCELALLILKHLDPLLFFVSAFFELRLLLDRIVQPGVEHLDLPLALFCVRLSFL
jgi:hypothetical protein